MNFISHLDREVPRLMARDRLPGAAVALIEKAKPLTIKTWGYADESSQSFIRQDSLFNVASISKAVTSWGVMKLVELGQIELDRPVETYLGDWRLPPSPYDHQLVTARRLLSHTAGINSEGVKAVDSSAAHYSTIDVLEGRLPALDERQRQYCLQWGIDPEHDRDPVAVRFPPGEAFHYANLGFIVLQLLIEKVSGRAFADFMQTEILNPLGMRTASYSPPDPSNPRLATAYRSDGSPLPLYRHAALAAGALYCSIEDLARFACAELNGGENVISRQGLAKLFERQCFAESLEGFDFDTGLGHYRLEVDGKTFVHHTGGVLGWRSVYGVIPQSGHGFCALINSDGGNQFWMELVKSWVESL